MSVDLRDRVAIVTGGGRGLCRAIACGYAGAGADVVISAARNLGEAEEVAALGGSLPGSIHAVQADISDAGDVDRLVARALELRGQIDVPEGVQLLDPEIVVPPALHLATAQSSGERLIATEWSEPA